MGNPKAKIEVVEYGSLTCPHCRHFAETAVNPLVAQYVRTGKASYEFRPFILDGIDVAANLVARCSGPATLLPDGARPVCDPADVAGEDQRRAIWRGSARCRRARMMVGNCRSRPD